MNLYRKKSVDYELIQWEEIKKNYSERLYLLRDCKGTRLRRHKKKGQNLYYYYIKRPGSKEYTYLGTGDHHEVKRIREARFLEAAIRRIGQNIKLLKALEDGFLSTDPSAISETLSEAYRLEVPPVSELYERESQKWRADRLEFQKRYPENYPQHKRHTTSDGVKVKTISELTLYERLKDAGLSPIYELPIPMKDYGPPLYPDATVLSPIDMKSEIVIEFVGRLDLHEYREEFARRVGRYIACGYVPGVNLFFVFNDMDGNIDSIQISKVIADIKGLRCSEAA